MATLYLMMLLFACSPLTLTHASRLVPALYVFGDSTVDGGNTIQYLPYGIDLNATIPIRWSNGKTIADFIASFLGLPIVPPFKNISPAEISKTGVNYAFASCGILPDTGMIGCWSFDVQIGNFNLTIKNNLTKEFNQEELLHHLRKSIFLISFGINDYKFHYLPPSNGTLSKMTPDGFAKLLLNELSVRLRALYRLGARKFVVNNIWPMGCTPNLDPLVDYCNETINQLVLPYSNGLPLMLLELQSNLPGAVFSHSDDFNFLADLKLNPEKYGITNTTGQCYYNNSIPICNNRDEYLYFDYIHTTQAANYIFSLNCFSKKLCSPLNILDLVGA